MIQRPNFRWDLLYGVALAVILTIAAAAAWMQSESWTSDRKPTTSSASQSVDPKCH